MSEKRPMLKAKPWKVFRMPDELLVKTTLNIFEKLWVQEKDGSQK